MSYATVPSGFPTSFSSTPVSYCLPRPTLSPHSLTQQRHNDSTEETVELVSLSISLIHNATTILTQLCDPATNNRFPHCTCRVIIQLAENGLMANKLISTLMGVWHILKHVLLVAFVIIYAFVGAQIFSFLEKDNEIREIQNKTATLDRLKAEVFAKINGIYADKTTNK